MNLNFIEIGTCNFDTLISKADESQRGISIEPISIYLNNLPNKRNVLKIHCGISNVEGVEEFYYIPIETIKYYKMPLWLMGCNSIRSYHTTAINLCKKYNLDYKEIIKKEIVNILPLTKIINIFNIESIDFLKIDTEGHDCIIMSDILPYIVDKKINIKKIQFEINTLSLKKDQNNIIQILLDNNYVIANKIRSNIILTQVEKHDVIL
jgi:hypothetical protein